MKTVVMFSLMICSIFLQSCTTTQNAKSNPIQTVSYQKPFDAMPREGWATDPNFSYRFYSYYPMDYVHGGTNQPYYHNPILY